VSQGYEETLPPWMVWGNFGAENIGVLGAHVVGPPPPGPAGLWTQLPAATPPLDNSPVPNPVLPADSFENEVMPPVIFTPPGPPVIFTPTPPQYPEQAGPPEINYPGPPVIFEPGPPAPQFEGPPEVYGPGPPEMFEPGPPVTTHPGPPVFFERWPNTGLPIPGGSAPNPLRLVDGIAGGFPPIAVMGPVLREIVRQVIRRIRTRPVRPPVRRRRQIEQPPSWPRRPRRYGEPTPAPRRAQPPRIPRQTPGEPEWTSPYPQIETRPVPLPPASPSVPREVPRFPAPSTSPAPPVPPSGEPPWRIASPPNPATAPSPVPAPPFGQPAPSRRSSRARVPGGSPTSWPLNLPGLLLGSAALSLLQRNRAASSSFPLQWVSPSPTPAPGSLPSPFPSVVPSPLTQPGALPLTGFNANPLPFAQAETARDRCHCPKPKRKKARKCGVRGNVVWQSGPKKGQLAGTRCVTWRD
jgi:hypothetical protein